jgi:hypothetical protein
MRSAVLPLIALLSLAAVPAGAQPVVQAGPGKVVTGSPSLPGVAPLLYSASNIGSADTRSVIAPALTSLDLPPDATAIDYLRAAQSALADGQTGRAQTALENAETLMTRPVLRGTAGMPDQGAAVSNIEVALNALAQGGTLQAMDIVQHTIPMAQQTAALGAPGGRMPRG